MDSEQIVTNCHLAPIHAAHSELFNPRESRMTAADVVAAKNPTFVETLGPPPQRIRDRFDNGVVIPELVNLYDRTINSYRARC